MTHSHDRWTIVLFRGTRATPLKISVRKKTIKRVLLAVVILAVVQVGGLAHYMMQRGQVTNQNAELEGLKEELSQSREQAVGFSEAIDNMQERVLTIKTINEKLQVMFGLAPEKAQDADAEGQGGEEVSYAAGGLGIRDGESLTEDGTGEQLGHAEARMAADIKNRLAWLERQTVRQLHMLARLEQAAGERVACGPRSRPSGPSKATCPQGSGHAFHPLPEKEHSIQAWISVPHEGKPCEPPPKAKWWRPPMIGRWEISSASIIGMEPRPSTAISPNYSCETARK